MRDDKVDPVTNQQHEHYEQHASDYSVKEAWMTKRPDRPAAQVVGHLPITTQIVRMTVALQRRDAMVPHHDPLAVDVLVLGYAEWMTFSLHEAAALSHPEAWARV